MAKNFVVSTAARNVMTDAFTALLNTGGAGKIKYYSGTKPAGPGTAITSQVLLATLTLSTDGFGDSSGGSATANVIASGTGLAAGTATWFRAEDGAGTAHGDGTLGVTAGQFDIVVNSTAITVGQPITISSLVASHPAS